MNAPDLNTVLKLRLAISQAATKKYTAVLTRQHQGRLHDMFAFCGASRTGRWAGRGVQLQNLKRPPKGQDNDHLAQTLLAGTFRDHYGGPGALEALGGAIRAAIAAGPEKTLVVRDLASIESRVLGWLTGDRGIQDIFAADRDVYTDFASRWLRIPYDQVTKEQRTLAKPPALGCGYGLGAGGLVSYAASMGVSMEEEVARSAVNAFRQAYPQVPIFWRWIENAFRAAMAGHPMEGYGLTIDRSADMARIRLPSSRYLYYWRPGLDDDGEILYWGANQKTGKWQEIRTYGARLTENVVQAIARDILLHGMLLADRRGLSIVFHVHDEIGVEARTESAESVYQALGECMDEVPPWARGLLLRSSGYINRRMRKD